MPRRLTRDTTRAVVAGVAAGFGRYLDVDPVLVRLAFVLLAFFNGFGVLVYLVGWAVMPREETVGPTGLESALAGVRQAAEGTARGVGETAAAAAPARQVLGWTLVALGTLLLLHNLDWIRWPRWASLETLWPLVLVAMGLGLLSRSLRRDVA